MLAKKQDVENIETVLNLAKKQGALKTIITRENCIGDCYAWILTKNNNLLYVQNEYFGGVSFSFKYYPTQKNGSGCQAGKTFLNSADINIDEIEKSGLYFARQLDARLFNDNEIKNEIIEILKDSNNIEY